MRTSPLLAVLVGGLLLTSLAAAACGDDDDDDSDAAEEDTEGEAETTDGDEGGPLSDEEYFAAVDELIRDLGEFSYEAEVLGADNAKAGLEAFAGAFQANSDGLEDIEPPEDIQDEHEAYKDAIDDLVESVEQKADETSEDTPVEEVETILFAEGEPDAVLAEPVCALATIAEEKGITTLLTCPEEEA